MPSGIFEVELRQVANDLSATVQVMSLTNQQAKSFVLRKFFPTGWEVTKVTKIRDLPAIK